MSELGHREVLGKCVLEKYAYLGTNETQELGQTTRSKEASHKRKVVLNTKRPVWD